MTHHLDRDTMDLAAAGLLTDPVARAHLEDCVACRRAIDRFREVVDARRAEMERDMPDWDAQRMRILDRLPRRSSVTPIRTGRRWTRPILAAAATLLIAVGGSVFYHRSGPSPGATNRTEPAVEDILAQTDSLLDAEGIPGFNILDEVTDEDVEALFGPTSS